ncbi:hypothetical protein IMSHALPRED_004036 [Imshaugia aleurites]|uniref:Flavoprotein pyridine nucleotide cytochrome reductase-like FAD-binding domain-containing protein n=1 Tax=Imshaugia aleurites TaxID=172621 RepID=A0A8H3I7A9_9LECA|nr:hypothetical protein IMSHALPRED_004036 [Imshaugia aleurites]
MQEFCCIRRCIQRSHDQIAFRQALQARRFAGRPSPGFSGFDAGKASGPPRSSKDKATGFNPTGPSPRPHKTSQGKFAEEVNNAETPPRTRFRIGPGKLILFSIAAFLSYKIYTWQKNPARSVILNPKFFTPFILESREKVSSTSAILNLLSLPRGQNTVSVSEAWRSGVWSVQVMQPELQIARSYTPLPPIEETEPEQVRLFVRQEPQGEVSTFLHKINRGTIVHLRGPKVEYKIPDDVDEILFLAGGTGIAPALQVAHTLYNHRIKSTEQGPELRILWANRRREDSIHGLESSSSQLAQAKSISAALSQPSQTRLVEEVESLKARHGGKVIVDYFVDEEGSYISESLLRTYLSGMDQTANQDGTPRKKVVLVSGPEGFVDAFAGPKTWQGGMEIQGPLGGLLKKINPPGWEIWKL